MNSMDNCLYATASNFGVVEDQDSRKPWVKDVTVPETIKRKYPSKHYVYKVVVKWTNGSETTIYRRYSIFFDFVVKLQELVSKLLMINPQLEDADLTLPDLPGKSLLVRTQTHQVAEKRRKKVEEFCQQLIQLPPEISESGLVFGFFNIWPDDTLLRDHSQSGPGHVISAPVLVSNGKDSPPPLLKTNGSLSLSDVTTPTQEKETSPPPLSHSVAANANSLDSIISHPDEMESLEQYRVLGDYERKDSHQVDLFTGQLVHVIEKHDTGWWMVMSDDEQGYAPAAFLESLNDGSQDKDEQLHTDADEVYEAMEGYTPISDDEVGFRAQDRIIVIAKSMDGWWKIRCNGQTGFAPAALIRRAPSGQSTFESEKAIYEELNIHQPPPRRNTLDRSLVNHVPPGYLSPRTHPELANIMENIYCDPAENSSDDDDHIYKVPRSSVELPSQSNGPTRQGSTSGGVLRRGSSGGGGSSEVRRTSSGASNPTKRLSGHSQRSVRSTSKSVSPTPPQGSDEYSDGTDGSEAIYANDAEMKSQTPVKKPVLAPKPAPPPKPKPKAEPAIVEDLYESMEAAPLSKEQSTPKRGSIENADLSKQSIKSSLAINKPPPHTPTKGITASKRTPRSSDLIPNHTSCDYEDLDKLDPPTKSNLIPALDDYVDMSGVDPIEDLKRGDEVATRAPKDKTEAPPPPPRVGKMPTKQSLNKSFSIDPELPVFEDEYIHMESSPMEEVPPTNSMSSPPAAHSPPKPRNPKPPPPPPYSPKAKDILTRKPALSRAKSMEDLLSSSSDTSDTRAQQYSPPLLQNNAAPPLPARNPPTEKSPERDVGFLPLNKPKPGKTRNFFKRNKQTSEFNDYQQKPLERSVSPIARHSISPPGVQEISSHPPLMHRNSEPALIAAINQKKITYVAVFSFSATSDSCLSFSIGDKCNLIKINQKSGWWLVRVGEKMGWTPGDYWKELNARDRSVSNAPLPSVPPPVVRKPRSHTEAAVDTPPGLDLTSSSDLDNIHRSNALLPSVRPPVTRKPRSHTVAAVDTPPGLDFTSSSDLDNIHRSNALLPSVRPPVTRKPRSHTVAAVDTPPGLDLTPSSDLDNIHRSNAPLPSVPPPVVRKPRSHTVAAVETSPGLDLTPSSDLLNSIHSSGGYSADIENSLVDSGRHKGKPSAPKSMPITEPGPPTPSKRPAKPPPPQKYSSTSSVVGAPPLPPANATRRLGSQTSAPEVGLTSPSRTAPSPLKPGDVPAEDYVTLDEVTESIENAVWFAGKMERVQAESFLMDNGRQREFLVRERTTKDGYYALSVRYHYNIRHFNIDPTPDGQYCMGSLMFPSIDDIIIHYQTNSLFIHDNQHVTLGQAVSKRKSRMSDKANGV